MISGRGVALFAIGVLSAPLWPSPWIGLLICAAVVLVLVVVDWSFAAAPRKVRMHRDGALQTRLGETVTVDLHMTNAGRRPLRGMVRDAWVPSAGAAPYAHRISLRPGQNGTVTTTLTPTRRGDRRTDRVTIRAYGPLRLAFRQTRRKTARRITPQWTLLVLPPFTSRKFLPEKLSKLRQLEGQLAVRGRGQGTEFDSLREYVDGDDVRSIDWRATARRDTVVVRTWRPERDRKVVCVVDTGRTSAARIADIPRLDASLDACLLLGAVAARADDRVDMFAVDTDVQARVTGAHRANILPSLVQAMARLFPRLAESDFSLMVSEVLHAERKRSLVVLFTALEPAALEQGLLPVLGGLTARHTVVLATPSDPTVAAMAGPIQPASGRRAGSEAVYQRAAAERALGERRRIVSALRRAGVQVVDAPADIFASKVADAYLELKAAGLL
ncbi:DUF58 domain-containing protein [Fodinicola acaciae]|uniref:DUF58 domain-containing protein n=1 Tax=Fodinicola acaciae TaxID=2681555 RepID=UPI0013D80D15|nr:DUF58 domain-containing protein [Fodinicola acaciae]